MTLPILLIIASCGLLFLGAEFLVRGGSSLALKLGLTPLVVGLTVVAYGTSTPELIVSVKAAMAGRSDMAIGNVVGSNIFNMAVILGLAALIYPIKTNLQILKWDAPVLVIVSLLVPGTFIDGSVSVAEGVILLVAAIAYTIWAVRMAKREEKHGHEAHVDIPEIHVKGGVPLDLVKIAVGIAILMLASRLLVDNSVIVAKTFGLSDTVIGLTIIAAGTSMPELATSVVAARRGQADIALGNVLGSSLFNLLFVLGGAAVINPVNVGNLQDFDVWFMIGLTVLTMLFLFTGRKVSRFEGMLLCLSYGIYLAVMWPK